MYVSENRGDAWVKQYASQQPYLSAVVTAGAGSAEGSTVVVLRNDGVLFINNDPHHQRLGKLNGTTFPDRPLGYGRDGIAVAPDGELVASFREGGIVFGHPSKRSARLERLRRPPYENSLEHGSWAFTSNHIIGNIHSKSFDDLLVFSPDYLHDGVVFGASYRSVYVSFDHGDSFQVALSPSPSPSTLSPRPQPSTSTLTLPGDVRDTEPPAQDGLRR